MRPRKLFFVASALAFLVACPAPYLDRATQVVFDPGSDDFWVRGLPSDRRREADGTYDLERWPGDFDNDLAAMWLFTADARLNGGWGVTSGAFLKLSGPIDEETLPKTPEASMQADASMFLFDVDPASPERGRRFPLDVRFLKEPDTYSPGDLLAAIPLFGFLRRPSTTYALVVTDAILD